MTCSASVRRCAADPSRKRADAPRAFSLLELVAVVAVVGVLAAMASAGWNRHVQSGYDAEALGAVDAIGRGTGMHAAFDGVDFDYSEAAVAAAVQGGTWTNPQQKTSSLFGRYGWAVGVHPDSGQPRAVIVMKSRSGACAVGVFGQQGARYALELVRNTDCVANGTVLAAAPPLSAAAYLPIPAPPPALIVVKSGRSGGGNSYLLTWQPPAGEITAYRVWSLRAPNYADAAALAGLATAPGAAWEQVATLAGTDTSYALPLNHSDPTSGSNGRWLLLYVSAVNTLGESAPSNLVPIIDGFVNGRGLWFACRTAAGPVRVLVQVPDSWPYPLPAQWRMVDQKGAVLRSGTAHQTGPFFVDVAANTKVGELQITYADGVTRTLSPANGSSGSDNSHGSLGACP